jgi:sec-independent protein translocase protein TatA
MFDSPMHLLILAVVVLVLFGGKKIPEMMKGLGQGVREFKDGMRGDPQPPAATPAPPIATNVPPSVSVEEKK